MDKHFLLAEDDEDDIEIMNEAIAGTGLPIKLTSVLYCDGIFNELHVDPLPHLIIVDGNLPGKTLLECIKEIRSHDGLRKIPLVVLSNTGFKHAIDQSYKAGINLFLEKPDSYNSMEDIIKRLYYINWSKHPVLTSDTFFELNLDASTI
jgi:CheY-like chemotaxis protein